MKETYTKKVSIVLPTYNGYRYIKEAIDSCLNQTYKNIELIIIDDHSLNDIKHIIQLYKDSRIIYFRNEKNVGLAESLNIGFSKANGEYLTWISDDNIFANNAIEIMAQFLEKNPQVDFVYTNYYFINEKGEIIRKIKTKKPRCLDLGNYIGPSFLYRKKIFEQIGGYNDVFRLAEDYEYWLRIRQKFKMKHLNKFLYYYRKHEHSLTSISKEKEIISQTQKASWNYISNWGRYYQKGLRLFFTENYQQSLKMFIISIVLNPFNIRSYYMVFLAIIKQLRKFYFSVIGHV
jgi:glycosyltransferase involved in cell wall biosynthesis